MSEAMKKATVPPSQEEVFQFIQALVRQHKDELLTTKNPATWVLGQAMLHFKMTVGVWSLRPIIYYLLYGSSSPNQIVAHTTRFAVVELTMLLEYATREGADQSFLSTVNEALSCIEKVQNEFPV